MDMHQLLARIPYLPQAPHERAAVILLLAVVIAFVARLAFRYLVHRLARSTDTDVDDRIAAILQGPVFWTFVFGGVWLAEIPLGLPEKLDRAIKGLELLAGVGMKYPIMRTGGLLDPTPLLEAVYSEDEG